MRQLLFKIMSFTAIRNYKEMLKLLKIKKIIFFRFFFSKMKIQKLNICELTTRSYIK